MPVKQELKKIFLNNGFQIAMAVLTFFVTVFNLYAASKLAPLVSRISLLETRANDDDKRNEEISPLIERFYVTESTVKSMKSDVEYIRGRVDDILDRL